MNGVISLGDYYLSISKSVIHKDGKPYTKSKTMESVKVTPPEGYEIDPKSTTNEIFFRKKDNRVRRWDDMNRVNGFIVSEGSTIESCFYRASLSTKNLWPTKELAEAALALSELMQYRQRWIGDWEPDFRDSTIKYYIRYYADTIDLDSTKNMNTLLSFPYRKMRDDFFNTFKDLLETAKPLL